VSMVVPSAILRERKEGEEYIQWTVTLDTLVVRYLYCLGQGVHDSRRHDITLFNNSTAMADTDPSHNADGTALPALRFRPNLL